MSNSILSSLRLDLNLSTISSNLSLTSGFRVSPSNKSWFNLSCFSTDSSTVFSSPTRRLILLRSSYSSANAPPIGPTEGFLSSKYIKSSTFDSSILFLGSENIIL